MLNARGVEPITIANDSCSSLRHYSLRLFTNGAEELTSTAAFNSCLQVPKNNSLPLARTTNGDTMLGAGQPICSSRAIKLLSRRATIPLKSRTAASTNAMESTLSPADVAVLMVEHGVAKHRTRYDKVFFKAFNAGVYLSFGGLLSEVIQGGSPAISASNPGLLKVIGGFVFPVGLVMIVLGGQELLTSNMMIFPMAAMKGAIPWWSIPVNWIIVTFGNLVGSLFFAAILVKYTGIVSTQPYVDFIREFAIKKAGTPEWHQIFLRGIGCNWLVCIAVWQAAGAKETISKIVAIWIPIWIFVACGYDHVVANMFSVPLGIMFGADLTVAEYIRKSLIAAFIGNAVGALFIALPYTYFYLGDFHAGGLKDAEEGAAPTAPNGRVNGGEANGHSHSVKVESSENSLHKRE